MPNELGRVLQALRQQQQQWQKLYLATLELNDDELRAALRSRAPIKRFAAAYVVGDRRLMWTNDLIGLVTDPVPAVRQAARRSLVILSFLALNPDEAALIASPRPSRAPKQLSELVKPVDFGPAPFSKYRAQKTAARKWTDWWASRNTTTRALVTSANNKENDLTSTLLRADGEGRTALIQQYREEKGRKYTDALAAAAVTLKGDDRRKVQAALDARMMRMTEATLAAYLEDDSAEERRAAVLAVALRNSKAHLSRMIDMLDDPDPAVVRAVVAGLRILSGKQYGPTLNATQDECDKAKAQWRQWAAGVPRTDNR